VGGGRGVPKGVGWGLDVGFGVGLDVEVGVGVGAPTEDVDCDEALPAKSDPDVVEFEVQPAMKAIESIRTRAPLKATTRLNMDHLPNSHP
jgi:hypothetical protein